MRFRALQTFDSVEVRSRYVTGLSYTVRPGNDLLAGLVKIWLPEGKVEVITERDATERKARITGSGKVV